MSARRLPPPFLLFDFDSTLVAVESLDELFDRVLAEVGTAQAGGPELRTRFRELTDAGMEGASSQADTLRRRLALFPPGTPTPEAVERAAAAIAGQLSPSVLRNRDFFRRHVEGTLVVSGGFSELIRPAVLRLGIRGERVVAHAFRPAPGEGGGLELDPGTPMARGGKVGAVRALAASGVIPADRPIWAVGDGATDLDLRTAGVAERFIAFAENVARPPVVDAADHVVHTFDELLELLP